MASEGPKTAESGIQAGRAYYKDKRYKLALEQFTSAMKLCSCNRGMKRERCSCKNYEQVVTEGGSIFDEAMYKCNCAVGDTFNKCENPHHIQALDYRAATFEALQELERARRDAEWILELAPRLPDGYLRLGKIARLLKKHELAWNVYNTGIEVGEKNGLTLSPKLQKLYAARQPLQKRFSRRDPLKYPQEIVQRIFSYIGFTSLVRCLRVSKDWQSYLTSRGNERLWRSLQFTMPLPFRSAPSINTIRKFVSYSQRDVRRLTIGNAGRFKLSQAKFLALLQGARKLEYLTIKGNGEDDIEAPQQKSVFSNLTHVVFEHFAIRKPDLHRCILDTSREKLEFLHITTLPQPLFHFPKMPNLKYLRLEEFRPNPASSLPIFHVVKNTPNLEQLMLQNMCLRPGGGAHEKPDELWPNLKVLVIRSSEFVNAPTSEVIGELCAMQWGSRVQHIDFEFRGRQGVRGPFAWRMPSDNSITTGAGNPELNKSLENLRSLRLTYDIVPASVLNRLLSDSILAKKLHSMDIVFPPEIFDRPLGFVSTEHLQKLEWLRGAVSIRCLGILQFRFKSYYRNGGDMPLLSFLASFPNLEVLEINTMHYEPKEFCTLVEAILKATKLKTVYQASVGGAMLDQLSTLAKQYGVSLIHGARPHKWPLPIED